MDGITVAAFVSEIKQNGIGMKIEKIYQPERDEINILFRGEKRRLLISVNPGQARMHFSGLLRENPAQAPMFCMLLRKLLTGSRLISVEQPGFDRIVHLSFEGHDELSDERRHTMVVEIMGKHSNLILLREDGRIVDSLKHVTPLISSVRVVMPGQEYVAPPGQGKRNPLDETIDDVEKQMADAKGRLDKWIVSHWSGISPDLSREIALRAAPEAAIWENLDDTHKSRAIHAIFEFFDDLKNERFYPTLVMKDANEPLACYPIKPQQYSKSMQRSFDFMSEAMDAFYEQKDLIVRMRQRTSTMQRILQQNIERCEKKMAIQQDILSQKDKMEEYRLFGELLTANLYKLSKGMKTAVVENYYDEGASQIEIPLDERFEPNENAQRYFKKYNKMKIASDLADEHIKKIGTELNYLEGQLENLNLCSNTPELNEIRNELIQQGYLRPDRANKGKKIAKTAASKPLQFVSSDGLEIFVGKNNAQNDRITFGIAQGDDIWLHAKDIPGSHVIIKAASANVPNQTLQEAAELAAYFSKGRNSSQVAVDYTPRKYVRKPAGAAPGYVIFTTNRTAFVTPDLEKLKKLQSTQTEQLIWQ